ncbi:phosphoribosylaminoimidazolesuccinocarboxamide synthase [Floricoccus penangensis]|uniref:Phosphoribosylaminoimidazole-succinocarboxamide synthase n=1 Tax=Floricoccus penangensis TaxID=1859475 RepID=A0A9Q5P132_9LACT|nr:phosphoribosylaminoimidazolesuccinocarboxamide synthase [Floricoccus penangensis]OFI47667.1 phosphoribosylaminoimidazolesuccinocarboxamide synthase [Floricoccus penangensis]
MEKGNSIYQGKAKELYLTNQPEVLWVEYLDQATALNGVKKDKVVGKGQMNNQITSKIFEILADQGIESHFIEKISNTEQLIKAVDIIPLEVVVRNFAAGSFSKRLNVEEGVELPFPIVEFYYKDDALDDPFINDMHVRVLDIASDEEVKEIKELALKVNEELKKLFASVNIKLIDFKIEVGRDSQGNILLADEISPDTCRLWDMDTNDHLDKDIYRRDLGDLIPVYEEVLNRINTL